MTTALHTLKASKLATNAFSPAQLSVFPDHVEMRSKATIGAGETHMIRLDQIANVSTKRGLGFGSLTIETSGGQRFTIDKVKASEAGQAAYAIAAAQNAARKA